MPKGKWGWLHLALPPALPNRKAPRDVVLALQVGVGWAFPNAVMHTPCQTWSTRRSTSRAWSGGGTG